MELWSHGKFSLMIQNVHFLKHEQLEHFKHLNKRTFFTPQLHHFNAPKTSPTCPTH